MDTMMTSRSWAAYKSKSQDPSDYDWLRRPCKKMGVEEVADKLLAPYKIRWGAIEAGGDRIAIPTGWTTLDVYAAPMNHRWERGCTPAGSKYPSQLRTRIMGKTVETLAVRILADGLDDDDLTADGAQVVLSEMCDAEPQWRRDEYKDSLEGFSEHRGAAALAAELARRTARLLKIVGSPVWNEDEDGNRILHHRIAGTRQVWCGEIDALMRGRHARSLVLVDIKCRVDRVSPAVGWTGHWNAKQQAQMLMYLLLMSRSRDCADESPAFICAVNPVIGILEHFDVRRIPEHEVLLRTLADVGLGLSSQEVDTALARFAGGGFLPDSAYDDECTTFLRF